MLILKYETDDKVIYIKGTQPMFAELFTLIDITPKWIESDAIDWVRQRFESAANKVDLSKPRQKAQFLSLFTF